MSHWVKCKSKINNKSILLEALKELKIGVIDSKEIYSQYNRKTSYADIAFVGGAVGMKRGKDGMFSLIGDPYDSKDKLIRSYYGKENELMDLIKGKYLETKVKTDLINSGFDILSTKTKGNNLVEITGMAYM